MRFNPLIALLAAAFAMTSCSSPPKEPLGERSDRVERPRRGSETMIAIVGTNDLHGALAPVKLVTREEGSVSPLEYQAGGAATFAAYLRVLRKENPGRLLWLDGGDELQGTLESNLGQGAPTVQFFNAAGLNAAALGNHEFDFDRPALQSRMTESSYPWLSANATAAGGGAAPLPLLKPSVMLEAGGLKVGVIGLSTLDTPKTTRPEFVRGVEFTDLKAATLREAKKLRDDGATAIILLAHVGLFCERGRAVTSSTIRKPTDPQGECGDPERDHGPLTDPSNELVTLLRQLPVGTVDAVVSGHSHQVVHHWVSGTPVIQGGVNGRYFNVIYLTIDRDTGRVVPDATRIEGPVAVCPEIFKNQGDCNGERPAPPKGRGALERPRFHGETISADPAVAAVIAPALARAETENARVVGLAARRLEIRRFAESELGNLVADAVREETGADIAFVNTGGIRAPLPTGPIRYGDVFRALPYENTLVTMSLTGAEIRGILRVVESGARGFYPVSGLRLRVVHPDFDAKSTDLDGDSNIEPWEVNRLLDAKLADGRPLQDAKLYTIATFDFLVSGGDDMAWPMSKLGRGRVETQAGHSLRDAVLHYLAKRSAPPGVHSEQSPLIDPAQPRLELVKAKDGKPRKRVKRMKRRRAR